MSEGNALNLSDEEAKHRILNRITREGIRVRSSFSRSFTGQYAYCLGDDKIPTIEIPQFTDFSSLIQAFSLAHELGHHYVYQNNSEKKGRLLNSGMSITTYWNEKLAWRETEQILKEEGILVNEQIKCSFLEYKNFCLNTYKEPIVQSISFPFKFLFDSVLLLIKLYGGFYILFGIALIFSANSIPIPFDDSLGIGSLNKSDLLAVTSEVVYIVLSLGGICQFFLWCYFKRSVKPVLFYWMTLLLSILASKVF
ncbi:MULTISPECIES: hypothetical protein [Bacillus]|uniref:hypothetical protein n=1 Tax=Bacillus TaxID=1386 RepID=UPI001ABEDCEC|nr:MULTISPECIES: hypothetical protein [Bacillus]MBR7817956.1 hypothetical protein [Bacillus sp. CCNWLCWHY013]MDJ0479984.1 hypothetical protein [Bacillus amyloliquefaciens]QTG87432.1 hypothetical protein J4048_22015 [Bacillus amyloliquefaciens]